MSGASDGSSGRVEFDDDFPDGFSPSDNGSYSAVASSDGGRRRATASGVRDLAGVVSPRDVRLLRDLSLLRCLTGRQFERLHLTDLKPDNRDRARRRILNRLVRFGLVTTLSRRIGGIHAGSAGLVYTLDAAGLRLLAFLDGVGDVQVRRPWETSPRFLDHTLAIAELYVRLREAERAGQLELLRFLAEPACWQPTPTLGTLKPDAYTLLARGESEYAWWIEMDLSTESMPTLRRKLNHYVLAAQAGAVGPDGFLPLVLVCVPDRKRLGQIEGIIRQLPASAAQLFQAVESRLVIERLASQ